MAWRDQLREASFRGVTFLYEEATDRFGKRLAKHQYPGRDEGYAEEMGLDDDGFTISAFLLEPDHIGKARTLEGALKKPGAGELVHPYLGTRLVKFENATRRFSTAEGGMVRFDITFTAAGRNQLPTVRGNTAAQFSGSSDDVLGAVKGAFETDFNLAGTPGFVAEDMAELLTDALTETEAALSPLAQGQDLARFVRDAAALTGNVQDLIQAPASLADGLGEIVTRPFGDGAVRAARLLDLAKFGSGLPYIPQTTATRALQAVARDALTGLVRGVSLAGAGRALSTAKFETGADAFAMLERFSATADDQMATASDTVYPALQTMVTTATRHVSGIAPSLPQLHRQIARTTEPALVTAQRLYGDNPETLMDRMEEIVRRNAIPHSGMVPGGETFEVLVRPGGADG